eukprot:1856546-Amphidinium_carterae.1
MQSAQAAAPALPPFAPQAPAAPRVQEEKIPTYAFNLQAVPVGKLQWLLSEMEATLSIFNLKG